MTVLVFGHRNPDTDAICAALAYADLLQRTTRPDAIACCCGAPNKRTEFALERAGLSQPRIVMDVRPEVGDVCRRNPIIARSSEVFFEVYQRMNEHGIGAVPVVDDDGKLTGVLTLLNLLQLVFEGDADPVRFRQVTTSVNKIRQVINGEFQHALDADTPSEMMVMVGAMSAEGFTQRLHKFPASKLIVVSGDRPTIQLPALEHGVRVMVVTGGYRLSPGLLQLAKANNVTVINSPFDTATTTMRIKTARQIEAAIERDVLTLHSKDPVADVRRAVDRSRQKLFPVLDDDGQLFGVLSKTDLVNPPRPKLVLVDHNELAQAVVGADEADIVEVLDHHRLGGSLKSSEPIRFINEPVGSTCTLVARQFRAAGLSPSPGIALCMASGIISDTLILRSPTSTNIDRECLDWLRGFCKVDLDEYAREFFAIGSALRSCTSKDVIREDCKEFTEHDVRFSISQIEEIGFELFWQRRDELLAALAEMAHRRGLEFSALLVTDIVSNGSLLLMSHEPDYWEEINYPRVDRHIYQLDNVVSRKKQLLPLIARLIASARHKAVEE
ncbi:MAG: putative manganese-dependent inorganic diphosphatase [Aureliella sp.]|jgi:manganese-dependent inorganic pyrophosphatase